MNDESNINNTNESNTNKQYSVFDESLLSAYLDGELSTDSLTEVENALHLDPSLRDTLEDLRQVRLWIQSIPQYAPKSNTFRGEWNETTPALVDPLPQDSVSLRNSDDAMSENVSNVMLQTSKDGDENTLVPLGNWMRWSALAALAAGISAIATGIYFLPHVEPDSATSIAMKGVPESSKSAEVEMFSQATGEVNELKVNQLNSLDQNKVEADKRSESTGLKGSIESIPTVVIRVRRSPQDASGSRKLNVGESSGSLTESQPAAPAGGSVQVDSDKRFAQPKPTMAPSNAEPMRRLNEAIEPAKKQEYFGNFSEIQKQQRARMSEEKLNLDTSTLQSNREFSIENGVSLAAKSPNFDYRNLRIDESMLVDGKTEIQIPRDYVATFLKDNNLEQVLTNPSSVGIPSPEKLDTSDNNRREDSISDPAVEWIRLVIEFLP